MNIREQVSEVGLSKTGHTPKHGMLLDNSGIIRIIGSSSVLPKLDGYYVLKRDMEGFFLQELHSQDLPENIFGEEIYSRAQMCIDAYFRNARTTGFGFIGDSGTGKTYLAKTIADKMVKGYGMPVIFIMEPFSSSDINSVLSLASERAVVFFDEFEKVYHEEDKANTILPFLDGNTDGNHLILITANERFNTKYINNRPGRMHYRFEYGKLNEDEITKFCDLYLVNKDYMREIIAFSKLSNKFSFDILRAIVSECNIYSDEGKSQDKKFSDIVKYLNIPNPFETVICLTYTVKIGGKPYDFSHWKCTLNDLLIHIKNNSELPENAQCMNFHIDSNFQIPESAINAFAKRVAHSIYLDSVYQIGDHETLLEGFLGGSYDNDLNDEVSEIIEYADSVVKLNKGTEESVNMVYNKMMQLAASLGDRRLMSYFNGYVHVDPRYLADFIKSGKDSAVIPSTIGEITVSYKAYSSYGFWNSGF